MKKSLIIGDVHLNEVYSDYFRCILFPFLSHVHDTKDYDNVIFVGDVFDASSINNATSRLFKELMSIYIDMEVVIVNGNHDKINTNDSIFDILFLPDNVTIYKDVTYDDNIIYIPHIDKSVDQHRIFQDINSYIKSNNLKEVFIYSHNDFNEIYKFKNNFFNISESFNNVKSNCFIINGHNHVPFFKKLNNNKLTILNIGCALNSNFNDTALNNYFIIVDYDKKNINERFNIFYNKYSARYYTFHVWKEDQIYEQCKLLNKENYSFIKFKIHDPTIVIDNNLKNTIKENYNVVDILVDYELDMLFKLKTDSSDSTSLSELCDKLNISIDEFNLKDDKVDNEKVEILFSLLQIMFENRETSQNDIDSVISTIKKYML